MTSSTTGNGRTATAALRQLAEAGVAEMAPVFHEYFTFRIAKSFGH